MQTRMAIGLGATQASGLRGNFGTMTKPFHPGRASQSGIIAAKMAGKGYESNPNIMEDRFGYAACMGEEMVQLGNMTRHLGYPWAIMGTGKEVANGIDIKIWPCCGGTHGSNTAIIQLLNEYSFKYEDVESVDIVTTDNPSCMAPNLRWPKSGLQGKFSTWYTVASLIVDNGRLDLQSFTDDSANRPELQSMLEKVNITQEVTIAERPNRTIGGESWWDVTVTLKNGSLINTRVPGHGDTYGPYTNIQVIDKFQALAGAVISPTQVDTLLNLVMDLENQTNVNHIMDAATLALTIKT
jgi:2-methylcitrate dehydratase PrpD